MARRKPDANLPDIRREVRCRIAPRITALTSPRVCAVFSTFPRIPDSPRNPNTWMSPMNLEIEYKLPRILDSVAAAPDAAAIPDSVRLNAVTSMS